MNQRIRSSFVQRIISYTVNRPDSPAIREGLAMYFDRKWWGIQNLDWTGYFLKTGQFIPVDKMLDREFFFEHDCTIAYPIMGAFTDWLIATYKSVWKQIRKLRQDQRQQKIIC